MLTGTAVKKKKKKRDILTSAQATQLTGVVSEVPLTFR